MVLENDEEGLSSASWKSAQMNTVRAEAARLCLLALLVSLSACGRVPDVVTASGARTSPPPPTTSPSPPPSPGWQVFTDSQHGFSISYPGGFIFKQEGGADPASGWLVAYRAVDNRFLEGYPPGQVEMGIYTKDAGSLTEWVQKHSDSVCGLPGNTGFFWDVTNMKPVTAAGLPAVSFDEDDTGCSPQATAHVTVLFLGSAYVFRLDWYVSDPNYSAIVEQIAEQMLATFKQL